MSYESPFYKKALEKGKQVPKSSKVDDISIILAEIIIIDNKWSKYFIELICTVVDSWFQNIMIVHYFIKNCFEIKWQGSWLNNLKNGSIDIFKRWN